MERTLDLVFGVYAGVDFWKNDWRQRSIYMVQTDRFDALDNPINECTALRDLTKYCGGTWYALATPVPLLYLSSSLRNDPDLGRLGRLQVC